MRDSIRKVRYLLTPREQVHTVVLLVLMAFGAVLELVSVSAVPAFVALLSSPHTMSQYLPAALRPAVARVAANPKLVLYAAGALLAISLVKNVFLAFLAFAQSRYIFDRQVSTSTRLLRAYLRAPYTFHLQRNTADLLRNANQEAVEAISGVVLPVFTLALEGLTIVAIMAVLIVREPLISLFALGLLGGATALFIRAVRGRMSVHAEQMHRRRGVMIRIVNEALGGIKITKVLGREGHFADAYTREAVAYAASGRFRQLAADLPRLYLDTAVVVGLLGVAALLMAQHRPSQAVIPVLSLFGVSVVRIVPSLNRVTGAVSALSYARHALSVVYNDIVALGSTPEPAEARRGATFAHEIRFEGVSFQYPNASRLSLNDVSLVIPRGAAVGVVGSTGAGKTTLVDLLLGLLEPTAGRIRVDGRDIRDDLRGWQRHVGYVPQDVYLTDDTIRRNVAIGMSDAEIDEAALARALDAAQLSEFVASLPDGVQTVVGERGVRLSGGQRQRIGIARALYNDPEVLIMDEATSSLDSETERYVMEAVERLRGDRTIVLIAHRMTTVQDCDTLVLLNHGSVACTGSYERLLARSPRFRSLVAAGPAAAAVAS